MKTISGSILASKPITLSKAASSMNKFLSSETGASTAISSYLRRSAAAFNELVQAHNELKGVRSERKHKHKKSRLEMLEEKHEENNLAIVVTGTDLGEERSVWYPENSGLGSVNEEGRTKERKKKKEKKRKQIDEVERQRGGHVEIEVEEVKEKETEVLKKKEKKRKQTDQIDEVERELGGHVEIAVEEVKETEAEMEKKKKEKQKKKSKKPVIEDTCLDDSEEQHRMKKKKKKKKKKRKHEIKT